MYYGDIALGDTIDIKFTTRQFSTGAPFTLAGSPTVAAYPGNSVTELTAGITLSVDFDARTGLNNVRVVATSGNGYATATDYFLVITAGTVDSVSVVGEVVGSFSIEKRSAATPAQVNTEVLDVLNTDTFAEPGQGAPAATTTLAAKLNYLFKWARNQRDNDGAVTQYYNDAGTVVDHTQATTESAGTVTKAKIVSGP